MSLRLEWNNEQEEFAISDELIAKLRELMVLAGQSENVSDGEVALTFVDDAEIQRLNKEYRNLDKPTDVLSFAMQEMGDDEIEIIFDEEDFSESDLEDVKRLDEETDSAEDDEEEFEEPLGDIIISVPRAIAQSEEYGHSVERELGFLFVHGFLHLIGYDHQSEEEEKVMFGKQEHILQQAGLVR
ncbi:rRNA maturation RNase YbeY [Paenibacillus sp. OAS669]|uniref:rRNA maturation RNase YbeY n=1 Tax=Paenibacillus sp. OAS669 TaxID=2663821 RepID=UPI00178BB92B|nr:rRNA maturation RNase YbeY [Paenibacillus sp. OAS669]MBE1443274.1 putative rRNA maturation factor [Paenibacillus sp. OAS669]